MEPPVYFSLWAKTDTTGESHQIHPLLYHMLDVGCCTLTLWNHALSVQSRRMFSIALRVDESAAGNTLAFWASLHDIGKAAPGFQRKFPPAIAILQQLGFTFPPEAPMPAPHGIVSAWALRSLLTRETGMPPDEANRIAVALGGHHGVWPTPDLFLPHSLKSSDKGSGLWEQARQELFRELLKIFQPATGVQLPSKPAEQNALIALFSGLVSVADWIGSMSEHFHFTPDFMPPEAYRQHAMQQAELAFRQLGWLGWRSEGSRLSFAGMFPATPTPNPIQQRTFDAALDGDLPALMILEAPTGIGKTEAALFMADNWLQRQRGQGMYIAMPTQATSNQMYDRVVSFLNSRYPTSIINAHLAHAGALLASAESPRVEGIAQDTPTEEGSVRAESWFLPRKRTLLAPFGVGTVDQALLSVLQTRHFFVRLFGLGQKVVVFDEVHAYDTYMTTLFERLLRWLHSAGSSVILLSATLPERTRQALTRAWSGCDLQLPPGNYPRLTLVSGNQSATFPLPSPQGRELILSPVGYTPQQIAAHLGEMLEEGGCAAVIVNRIQRAQEIYSAIREAGDLKPEYLILYHARFPFAWRKEIEERVIKLFSKGGIRPRKAVVVATQVIEQSLDLDFDYMVSDLAPVDLLIQRAGRLQRHAQHTVLRPPRLQQPTLGLAWPSEIDGLPDFGLDTYVYDLEILLRSWVALRRCPAIRLPEQTQELIEMVYGDRLEKEELSEDLRRELLAAAEQSRRKNLEEIAQAKIRVISGPDDEELLTQLNEHLEEEDERVNEAFRALTRLGEPGVSLICLYQTVQGLALEADGRGAPLDLNNPIQPDLVKALLLRSVNVQRKNVVRYVITYDQRPTHWQKSAALRNQHPVIFDPSGYWQPPGADFSLKLSRELGLEILKTSQGRVT